MILFENDDVLALDKPPGVSMATSSKPGKSAEEAVARLVATVSSDAASFKGLLLVHRLDVGTSGVVLLAKSETAHRILSRVFQERGAKKTYRALVWGHPVPTSGSIDLSLGRDPADGRKMKASRNGKPARTAYRTLERLPGAADLEVTPETGRTHQIRVHLAAKGHPIVGDDFYGGATRWHGVRDRARREVLAAVRRPLLHAERIEIPAMGLDVFANLPLDYGAVLDSLRKRLHEKPERVAKGKPFSKT